MQVQKVAALSDCTGFWLIWIFSFILSVILLTQTEIQQTIRPAQTNAPVNVEGMERLVEKGAAHRHEAVDAQHEDHEAAGVEAKDSRHAQVEAGRVAHDQKAPVVHRAQNGHDAVGEAERAADQVAPHSARLNTRGLKRCLLIEPVLRHCRQNSFENYLHSVMSLKFNVCNYYLNHYGWFKC